MFSNWIAFSALCAVCLVSSQTSAQLVVGTQDAGQTSVSLQATAGSGSYTPLFQQDARALAWDGNQFHGSSGITGTSGNNYWTAPLNGPATIVGRYAPNGTNSFQAIDGLAFGNGVLYGSDTAGNATSDSPEGIYTIDSNGNTTTLCNFVDLGLQDLLSIGGLAFNSDDGLLYGTNDDSNMQGLVSIDPHDCEVELIAAYPNGEADIDGLAVGNNTAWLIDDDAGSPGGGPGLFYSYDLSQGTNGSFDSFAGAWSSNEAISSGAWITETVPEPGTGGCVCLLAIAAGVGRKRRV